MKNPIICTFLVFNFSFLQSQPSDPKYGVRLSADYLTPEILWNMGRVGNVQLSPDGKSVLYTVTRYNIEKNKGNSDIYMIPSAGGEPKQLTATDKSEWEVQWSHDGKKIGFLINENDETQAWEMNADGSERHQLSFITDRPAGPSAPPFGPDGKPGDLRPGRASSMGAGIESFQYSPHGTHILYTKEVKLEISPKEMYPDLPLASGLIYDDMMYRHWDSWHDYSYRHIFYASIENDKVTMGKDIMAGESFDSPLPPYFSGDEICWSPDGKIIAYTSKKLKGKEFTLSTNSDIYLYHIETGKTENISEGMPGYDRSPVFSNDGKKIAWQSMKTGGYESDKDRLFVMDLAAKTKTDLTAGHDYPVSHIRWSPDDKKLFFLTGIKATDQIYSADLMTKKITPVTQGQHDYMSVEVAGSALVGSKMSISMAPEIFRVDEKTGKETQLTFVNKSTYEKVKMGKVEEKWIRTTDGKEILTWIIYPPDFDAAKKYPALLYCQGGPQSTVSQFFSFRWNFQLMAANGYIVIAPNRRGLPSFGSEWNDQIAGDYGGQNMKDLLAAVDVMKKEPFIAPDRIGAVGASYGGYTVYWLAGHHENRFKAFVSHCGIYNLESKYGSTDEYFFPNHDLGGPYWQEPKPKSFEFSPHLAVSKWNTPILIITGEKDYRIPYSESLQAFNMANLVGVPARLLYFPNEGHQVLKPQNSIEWNRVFFEWLEKWLKK